MADKLCMGCMETYNEKYADVTVCEDGLELEETIEKVLASLN